MLALHAMVIGLVLAAGVMASCSEERIAPGARPEQSPLVREVHQVLAQKGYPPRSIDVDKLPATMTIRLSDSVLLRGSSQERQAEAADIVSTMQSRMSQNAEFGLVQIIRFDYLRSDPDKATRQVVDAIEFYRAPDGTFRHHKS